MKMIGVFGNFGSKTDIANGQFVKTKTITNEIIKNVSKDKVQIVNTYEWKKNSIRLLYNCIKIVISCKNILILPAQNGIKVFAPIFVGLGFLFNRKIHYSVIGGWLPEYLSENNLLRKIVSYIDVIYVETRTMQEKLLNIGMKNVVHMPNFKYLSIVSDCENIVKNVPPYSLCTFSRVKKEKGIIDAIEAVTKINKNEGGIYYTLDIYGAIDKDFQDEFNYVIQKQDEFIKYKGLVDFNKSTEVLKNYFALLFPTYYEGEGFPGTILDAFSSGLPVVATNWRYNSEIVRHGETGLIYEFVEENRVLPLVNMLEYINDNSSEMLSMRKKCIEEASKYDSDVVIQTIITRLA